MGCAEVCISPLFMRPDCSSRKALGRPSKGGVVVPRLPFAPSSTGRRLGVREVEALNLLGSAFTLPLSRRERKSPSRFEVHEPQC